MTGGDKVRAGTAGAVVTAEVAAAVVLTLVLGLTWSEALDGFIVTNALMGLSFGLCGAVIAWHRPRNPVGWLLVAAGLGHATTAMAVPLAGVLAEQGAPMAPQRLASTVAAWAWPWSIGLLLPLALLLFPTGRLPSPRWRPVAVAFVVTAPLFAVQLGTEPEPIMDGNAPGYLTFAGHDDWAPLWVLSELRVLAFMVLALVALVLRYRRGDARERSQLLWLLLATLAVLVVIVPWSLVAGTPVLVLFAIPLIPVAIAAAVVRHQLLDIRLVVSRALTWALLSLGALAVYLLLVTALDRLLSPWTGRSVLATLVVALLVGPLYPRLQRLVEQVTYGDRRDPAQVMSSVAPHLHAEGASFAAVAGSLADTLRMPYVAVLDAEGQTLGEVGRPGVRRHEVELQHAERAVGTLVLGLRPGERTLSEKDARGVALLTAPLALAVHATSLTEEVRDSRERMVTAVEEERRRLRRELHDDLGPVLTGLALASDAAANLRETDPERADELVARTQLEARHAIASVRRVVDGLRPPVLDELGLVGALRQRAEELSYRSDGSRLAVQLETDPVPPLPAALEVAVYRVATEALTNVARHADATRASVTLRCGDELVVRVVDDGAAGRAWRPGVGLSGMRQRIDELGGQLQAGPDGSGGRVIATFPLVAG
ncbi:MAG TPA: histidine kinase [Nocardioides sp.]|nr:histidine kinase [Nocardioides sp.]